MIPILGLPVLLVTLGLLAWALSGSVVPGAVFCIGVVVLDVMVFTGDRIPLPPPGGRKVSPEKQATYERHRTFLWFPSGSQVIALWLNITRFSAFLWAPVLLWHQHWLLAGVVVAHFVVTSSVSVRLAPMVPYARAASQGNMFFKAELWFLQRLLDQFHGGPLRDPDDEIDDE